MQTAGNRENVGTTTDEMPAAAERLVASLSHRFVQQSLHRLAHRSSMAASSAPNPKDVKLAAMRRGRLDDPEDEVDPKDVAKFGTVLGLAAGGVRCLACKSLLKYASHSVS